MKEEPKNVQVIEKELISNLVFPAHEVLADKHSLEERKANLFRATSLGNLESHKVYITFEDAEGLKCVNTTIWAVTDRKAILKGGRSIPVNRIHSVEILR